MTTKSIKKYFTYSITVGFALIGSVTLFNVVAGFISAVISTGDSAYIGIRTLNYGTAPYVFFAVLGFVLYHSSKRSDFIIRMFNLAGVMLALVWLVVAVIAAASSTLLSEMLETLYIQNLTLSILVVITFSLVMITSAWRNKKLVPVKP